MSTNAEPDYRQFGALVAGRLSWHVTNPDRSRLTLDSLAEIAEECGIELGEER